MSAGSPSIAKFQTVYIISGIAGMISLIIAIKLLTHREDVKKGKSLMESYRKFLSGIKEVISDKRILITSNMEGLQNMTVGTLEAFLPVYAVKIAGLNEFQAGLLWGMDFDSKIRLCLFILDGVGPSYSFGTCIFNTGKDRQVYFILTYKVTY